MGASTAVGAPSAAGRARPRGEQLVSEQLAAHRADSRGTPARPAHALPSTRGLAAELGVSRGVVTEAYGQLAAEGYLSTRQGAPVRVSAAVRAAGPARPRPLAAASASPTTSTPACPTSPASPASAGCARCARRCASRRSTRSATATRAGVPELREALADYLGRVRGAAADPEQMIVCTGFMQGFSLLCRGCAAAAWSGSRWRTPAGTCTG